LCTLQNDLPKPSITSLCGWLLHETWQRFEINRPLFLLISLSNRNTHCSQHHHRLTITRITTSTATNSSGNQYSRSPNTYLFPGHSSPLLISPRIWIKVDRLLAGVYCWSLLPPDP
jgi:hypothetical protein